MFIDTAVPPGKQHGFYRTLHSFYSQNPCKVSVVLASFYHLENYGRQIFTVFSKATHSTTQCETVNFWTLGRKGFHENKEPVRQDWPAYQVEMDPKSFPQWSWGRLALRIEGSSQIVYDKLEPMEHCQW